MKTKAEVPVFYLDDDCQSVAPCKLVSRTEARTMKHGGVGWFIDHGKAFRLLERAPEDTVLDPRRVLGSIESAATITVAEMRANVGDVDESVRNPRETVRRAQAKIKLYPFIFDRRAPGARCDWFGNTFPVQVSA
jgi:hypothetical protein